jgi:hypothetical protein
MTQHTTEELSEDFKLMRKYDAEWSAPRLIAWGAAFLALAIGVIYTMASISEQ